RSHRNERHGRMFYFIERIWDALASVYERCLKVVLRHQPATMMVSILLLVATVYLYQIMPKGFLPSEDIEQFNATTEAVEGISFDAMVQHQKQVAEIVAQDPAVAYVMSQIGGDARSNNQGQLNVRLKPRSQRPQVEQVMQSLRPKV